MNLQGRELEDAAKPAGLGAREKYPSPLSPSAVNRQRWLLTGLLVAIAFALGFGIWTLWRRIAPEINASASAESAYVASFPEKSIAVLPFRDASESKRDGFLANGVQDDILTALSKVADLKVISRTSANSYPAGGKRDLRDISQSLGAAYIVQGNVLRTGEKVEISIQLTDARRNTTLWTQKYERDVAQLFGMQSQIVQRIAAQMQANITPREKAAIEERPTKDPVAYGLYLRAKELIDTISLNAQINEKGREAVQLLDQAVARDPDFFLAYCQLTAAHGYLYFFGLDRTPARLALAEAALKTVSRLRPDAGETHLARAGFFYRCYLDYARARSELALAQRSLPNNSEIFELTGYIDRRQGLWNESARSLQHALELDPRSFFILQQIALSYQECRQFGAMAAAFDRALLLIPHDSDTRVNRASVDLEWKADTQPLHQMIQTILKENAANAPDLAAEWFYLALCERDSTAVTQALAAIPASGTAADLNFPRTWCEGLAAHFLGDTGRAKKSFLAAHAEVEHLIAEQPNYAPAYCVLGLIDAALGNKEQALMEGRRATEMLPITTDSIDGAEIVKYLGVIYTLVGEKDLAIEQIAATLKIPSTLSYGNLKLHPYWDSLRGDPRFEKMATDLAPKSPTK